MRLATSRAGACVVVSPGWKKSVRVRFKNGVTYIIVDKKSEGMEHIMICYDA
jgi:hypothetical protein